MFACAAQVHAGSKLLRDSSVGCWQVTVRSQREEEWVVQQTTDSRHRQSSTVTQRETGGKEVMCTTRFRVELTVRACRESAASRGRTADVKATGIKICDLSVKFRPAGCGDVERQKKCPRVEGAERVDKRE